MRSSRAVSVALAGLLIGVVLMTASAQGSESVSDSDAGTDSSDYQQAAPQPDVQHGVLGDSADDPQNTLPAIQASFGVSTGIVQMTLSVSMIAIALSTLVYGPLSDRYGRRPVMIVGLLMFVIGTLICGLAPSIWVLIFGRIVQAAGVQREWCLVGRSSGISADRHKPPGLSLL